MSAADKRLKAKPKKAENQKRVCQKFMTHPLFFISSKFSSSIFLHRITRSYRNILALRITHGFSQIFGRWPMAGAPKELLLVCHADFADDADFSSWKFFVPQISQIFTDFYGISGESLSPLSGGIRNDRTGRLCENP